MRWIKASERPPKKAGWYHTDVGLIQFDLVGDGLLGNEPPFEWMWLNRGHGMVTKWIDEELPADIEQEAERLYPDYEGSSNQEKLIQLWKRSAHISAARQYMGEVEKYMKEIATWKELAHKYVDRIKELEQAVELYRKGISNYNL